MINRTLGSSLFVLAAASCSKRKGIMYPLTGKHGENALALSQITQDVDYSLAAKLGKKAELKVVITNTSPAGPGGSPEPVWFFSSEEGWAVSAYNDTQTFSSTETGNIDLLLSFSGTGGSCRLDIYENGASDVTKTKIFTW